MTKKIRKYILFLVITVQENKNYQDFKICTRGFPEINRFCLYNGYEENYKKGRNNGGQEGC